MPHGQSEQFSLKSIKEIYISAKIVNPCQFINDPLKFPSKLIHMFKHLDNLTSHSKMKVLCTVTAVIMGNYGCMKAVISKSGWDILQTVIDLSARLSV